MNISPAGRIVPLRQGICGTCVVGGIAGAVLVICGALNLYFHIAPVEKPAPIKGASK